jgi:hypothetical protein
MQMDLPNWLWQNLDLVLMAPYRLPSDPVWGWWLGTFVLAVWATLIGEITLYTVFRLNRRFVDETTQEMQDRQRQALNALKAGEKRIYKGLNDLANEAFGKAFFLQVAMGASSLWPAFLAAGWLEMRFNEVPILLPFALAETTYLAGFTVIYLLVRVGWGQLKKRLGLGKRSRILWQTLKDMRQRKKLSPAQDL